MKRRILFGALTTSLLATLLGSASVGADGGSVRVPKAKPPIWNIFKEGTGKSVKWRTHRPNPRFAIYNASTPDDNTDDAVLDKETGLIYERFPSSNGSYFAADDACFDKKIGNRLGSRVPTVEELTNLVDLSQLPPTLPKGHPFLNVNPACYWSSTTNSGTAERTEIDGWCVDFSETSQDNPVRGVRKDSNFNIWCLRGGQGYDAY